jgi:hypothetical protein
VTTTPGTHPSGDGTFTGPGSSPIIRPKIDIPPEHDPRLVDGSRSQRERLAQLSPAQRAALVLDRYPELRALPNCDWQLLSARASFSVLFGESARHYANLELAALAGILASAGISAAYAQTLGIEARHVLDLLHQRFGIVTPRAITLDVWEAWGRDANLMRLLAERLGRYAAAVNLYLGDYRERLNREDLARVDHLLLPPLPKQFRQRFVPRAEHRVQAQRSRKAKTDVVSECAMAILALMLTRYPSMERFISWYRQQIERIEAGELSIPARLVYQDDQLDLPSQPGPDTVNVEELRWRTTSVQLDLTIWRSYEFGQQRHAERIQHAVPGTKEWVLALRARSRLGGRVKARIHADPHAYFVEVHPTQTMPWFMGPVNDWFARFALTPGRTKPQADGGTGRGHAGVGTPEDWLAKYLSVLISSDRYFGRNPMTVEACFDPEATYRGVLFGTAAVTLMLTADARIHEILQISTDHFVKPIRVYVVKNPDGTPKYDSITKKVVTDVIVEQRLLPKGRTRDDLRLQYDVSAARVHLQEMTRLLKAAHGGHIPIVHYDPQHPKAEQLGAERYLFQWNGRHLARDAMNGLIRMVLHGVVLVDRSGERISVTSHLLRHAAATVQRQRYGVPLEILAEAMGHTLTADGRAPEATRYYSQMTETQKTEIRHEAIVAMMDDARLAVRVIEPDEEAQRIQRLMAEADEHTRDVLERYGGLHPVTFGHCGYPGLCVRGTARAFCIGCPFLVRRPEYVDRVDFFLDGYVKAADAHERMGDLAGARERHRFIAQLKQLRSEMLLLAEAERQGNRTPSCWQQVPSLPAALA